MKITEFKSCYSSTLTRVSLLSSHLNRQQRFTVNSPTSNCVHSTLLTGLLSPSLPSSFPLPPSPSHFFSSSLSPTLPPSLSHFLLSPSLPLSPLQFSYPLGTPVTAFKAIISLISGSAASSSSEMIEKFPLLLTLAPIIAKLPDVPILMEDQKVSRPAEYMDTDLMACRHDRGCREVRFCLLLINFSIDGSTMSASLFNKESYAITSGSSPWPSYNRDHHGEL